MQHNEGLFKTTNRLHLYEQWWRPAAGPIKAVVVIVHGYSEHSSRYGHVAEHLTANGYGVDAFDLRGHGQSGGLRAFVWSFDEYLQDLECFFCRVREREPEKPIFLLGHSLGGTVVTLFTITRKPATVGVLLSGAALKLPRYVTPQVIRQALFISFFVPKFPLLERINSRVISRSPEVVAKYESDPLVYHGRMRAREGVEIMRAMKRIQDNMEAMTLPVMIMHGTRDHLTEIDGSQELYRRALSTDKTLKLYEGFYHEIMNEPYKAQVLTDITAWLDGRLNPGV